MKYAEKYYDNIRKMVFKHLRNKNITEVDKEDIFQIVLTKIDDTKWKNEEVTEKDVCKVAGTIAYREYMRHFNKIRSNNKKHETVSDDFKTFMNDIKFILTDEENKLMDLVYNYGYSFLEISDMFNVSDRTVRRRHDEIVNKIKKFRDSNINSDKNKQDDEVDDFDLIWDYFKENDLCDDFKCNKSVKRENKSVFPNITIKDLSNFIKEFYIDESTESELWFLYQNDVNTYGFNSKYENNRKLIEDIIKYKNKENTY